MLDKKSLIIWIIALVLMSARWIVVDINTYHKVHNAEVRDRVYNMYIDGESIFPINDDYRDMSDLY